VRVESNVECSTLNISQRWNKRNRKPLIERLVTDAQRAMRRFDVTNRAVSDLACVSLGSTNRALSLQYYKCRYGDVMRIRAASIVLLQEAGWAGDVIALWHEYNQALYLLKGVNDEDI